MTEKTEQMTVGLVDTVPALEEKLAALRTAQAKFATYTQEQVDCIFRAAAIGSQSGTHSAGKDGSGRNWHGRCGRQGHQEQLCSGIYL